MFKNPVRRVFRSQISTLSLRCDPATEATTAWLAKKSKPAGVRASFDLFCHPEVSCCKNHSTLFASSLSPKTWVYLVPSFCGNYVQVVPEVIITRRERSYVRIPAKCRNYVSTGYFGRNPTCWAGQHGGRSQIKQRKAVSPSFDIR